MCPSYMVTREEEHSTRGRARLLFEMLDGTATGRSPTAGARTRSRTRSTCAWPARAARPTAPPTWTWPPTRPSSWPITPRRRWRRPRSDLTSAGCRLVARAGRPAWGAGVVNAVTPHPGAAPLVAPGRRASRPREIPLFAAETLQQWPPLRAPGVAVSPGAARHVLLWPDTFTNHFHPHVGQAAVEVLEAAGCEVEIPAEPLCCGLTWISTGSCAPAKRVLGRTVARLRRARQGGRLVVGLEPSCTTVFRSRPAELFPDDQDMHAAAGPHGRPWPSCSPSTRRTGAAGGRRAGARPGALPPARRAGLRRRRRLLADAGARAEALESGCCGLAGNFGFEPGHGDVSRALRRTGAAAQAPRRRARRGPAGRRLQLPYPDPRARQRRPRGHAPSRAAGGRQ